MSSPNRLAILISGGGRTMINLADCMEKDEIDAEVALVIASRQCAGAEKARERGFPTVVIQDDMTSVQFSELLADHGADWAALAGFLRLVPIPETLRGRVTNIHPALLPLFGGRGMFGNRVHQAVLDSGMKVSGCTVHLCDDRYDTGPILVQKCCPVLDDDDATSLAARVFELEKQAYPEALSLLFSGRMRVIDHQARLVR